VPDKPALVLGRSVPTVRGRHLGVRLAVVDQIHWHNGVRLLWTSREWVLGGGEQGSEDEHTRRSVGGMDKVEGVYAEVGWMEKGDTVACRGIEEAGQGG